MGNKYIYKLAIVVIVTLSLIGCATMNDSHQVVFVQSVPPGATIINEGVNLGHTPAFVNIKKRARPQIQLLYDTGDKFPLQLKTRYDWRDSFFPNILLFSLAPAGWITDWVTGAAWQIEDPPLQNYSIKSDTVGSQTVTNVKSKVIIIAPPEKVDPDLADGIGVVLEEYLREKYPKVTILGYKKTTPAFDYSDIDISNYCRNASWHNLIHEFKADHVFCSNAEIDGSKVIITGYLKNVFTQNLGEKIVVQFSPQAETKSSELKIRSKVGEMFHLMPNTLFLNFADDYVRITQNDAEDIRGKNLPSDGFLAQGVNALSTLSLAHLERPRPGIRGRWHFNFVPQFMASYKSLDFPASDQINDVEFQRWLLAAGYGPELGYLSRFGYLYFDLIPMLGWSQIRVAGGSTTKEFDGIAVPMFLEIGYSYFFTKHLVGKIFTRGVNEDDDLWNEALDSTAGTDIKFDTVTGNVFGVSIGYYFPEDWSKGSQWQRQSKIKKEK